MKKKESKKQFNNKIIKMIKTKRISEPLIHISNHNFPYLIRSYSDLKYKKEMLISMKSILNARSLSEENLVLKIWIESELNRLSDYFQEINLFNKGK